VTLVEHVVLLLRERGVPHAIIGAAALAAAGVARSTYDIDLLTTDPQVLDAQFWAHLRQAGVSVDARRGDSEDPLAGVVRLARDADRPVDLIVGRDAWQDRAIARALPLAAGPPVVQARDLVLLKLYAGGAQDVWDIRALLDRPDRDTLVRDVTADLAEMPPHMRELWDDARR
jgi:hypothetical protein